MNILNLILKERKNAFFLYFIFILLIFLISGFYYYKKSVRATGDIEYLDFRVFYESGIKLGDGREIYDKNDRYFVYKYAPLFALFMLPFKYLHMNAALITWYALLFVSFFIAFYYLKEALDGRQKSTAYSGLIDTFMAILAGRFFILSAFTPYRFASRSIFYQLLDWIIIPSFMLGLVIMLNKKRGPEEKPMPYLPVASFFIAGLAYTIYRMGCRRVLPEYGIDQAGQLLYIAVPVTFLLYGVIVVLYVLLKEKGGAGNPLVYALASLFVLRFLLVNVSRAQANILVLLFLSLFIYCLCKERDWMAGLFLGFAILIKLTPAVFIYYLAVKKRLRAAATSVVSFLVLLLLPATRLGFSENIMRLKKWFEILSVTAAAERLQSKNQSVASAVCRFFSKDSGMAFFHLDDAWLNILIVSIYISLTLVASYYVLKNNPKARNDRALLAGLSLFTILMVLFSPVATKGTFIHLAIPCVFLINEAFAKNLKDKVLNGGLALYFTLSSMMNPDILKGRYSYFENCSIITVSALLLFVLLLRSLKERPD